MAADDYASGIHVDRLSPSEFLDRSSDLVHRGRWNLARIARIRNDFFQPPRCDLHTQIGLGSSEVSLSLRQYDPRQSAATSIGVKFSWLFFPSRTSACVMAST